MTTSAKFGVILMPNAEERGETPSLLSTRISRLEGTTIGIVNNSWRCMNILAEELATVLTSRFGVVEILEERISAAQTLPANRLDCMAARCHAVIVGIGN